MLISSRECAIKFNDYFEFPRELDMDPYTVQGLAKIEGELIADENEEVESKGASTCTKYRLVGLVVHSGQASGGHYYSYILHRWVAGVLQCAQQGFNSSAPVRPLKFWMNNFQANFRYWWLRYLW